MTSEPQSHPDLLSTVDEFKNFVASVQAREGYRQPFAFAIGWATIAHDGTVLDTRYPVINTIIEGKLENAGSAAVFADAVGHLDGSATYNLDASQLTRIVLMRFAPFTDDGKTHANIRAAKTALEFLMQNEGAIDVLTNTRRQPVVTFIGHDGEGPKSVQDAYLRMYLLSRRKVKPHGIKLDGIFGILPIVAWTNRGPMLPAIADDKQNFGAGLWIYSIDKFPPMSKYVVLDDVRICDGARVRFGAYIGKGTTIMHEGFVNFNAGTEGPAMVEGRISAGVFVRKNSDIGGGASIMGTLSGGGKEVITIGEHCLIGANGGTGISLGDRCTIEAGLYVTANCKVYLIEHKCTVKASTLSGKSDMLLIRNSETGRIELHPNKSMSHLNPALHATKTP
jgi:2,3,4,5-tetrahydropyridine-2-carboxylate N-succinyltransferase